jgi:hypothetical protein
VGTRPCGSDLVEMSIQAEAQRAVSKFHGHTLNERGTTANLARPCEERGGIGNSQGGSSRY